MWTKSRRSALQTRTPPQNSRSPYTASRRKRKQQSLQWFRSCAPLIHPAHLCRHKSLLPMQFQKFFLRLLHAFLQNILPAAPPMQTAWHPLNSLSSCSFLFPFAERNTFHAYQVRCRKQQHSPHRPVKQPRCHSCRSCSHCRTSQFLHKTCPVFL